MISDKTCDRRFADMQSKVIQAFLSASITWSRYTNPRLPTTWLRKFGLLPEDSGCIGAGTPGGLHQLRYELGLFLFGRARVLDGRSPYCGLSYMESQRHVLSTLSQQMS